VHLRLAKLASLLSSGFSPSFLEISTTLYNYFACGSICSECSIRLRQRLLSALKVWLPILSLKSGFRALELA
jgi:hypothetical protein